MANSVLAYLWEDMDYQEEVASKVLGFFLPFVPLSIAETDQPSPWASGSSSFWSIRY